MRKIVVTTFLSLDGVMESPAWSAPYWSDEVATIKADELATTDAQLLGRVTYQGFAKAWPESTDEGAPEFNAMKKYVVSTTLQSADWQNSEIIRDVADVQRLKEGDGGDLLVYGSANLIASLMQHNLIDEYTLLLYPVVVGSGTRLFTPEQQATLKLTEARALDTGVVLLRYVPDNAGK